MTRYLFLQCKSGKRWKKGGKRWKLGKKDEKMAVNGGNWGVSGGRREFKKRKYSEFCLYDRIFIGVGAAIGIGIGFYGG